MTSFQYNLIGIKEVETPEGHDHVSGLQKAYDSLTNKGVSSSAISCYYDTTFSPTRFESKLEGSSILVYRGHGGTYSGFGTGVLTNPSATAFEDRVFTSKDMQESLTDLTDTDLALFIGCETGYETTDIPNLVETAVSCGAETALGFRLTILCGDANTFTDRFFDFLVAGNTVLEAARNAAWLSNEEQERKVNFHDVYFSTSIQYFDMEGNSYYKLT